MKICALIAEYNPFHNGHLKHIEYIKNQLDADRIIVLMSGNFTQRGEPALLNKYTRARHAILAGADLVIELPTVFATANAETFATGSINILNALGVVDGICFGVESGVKEEYTALASAMLNESKDFKKILKTKLEQGVSLAKAKFETVKEFYRTEFNSSLIGSPNNILGLEYTKAILKNKSNIEIYPMLREGDHNDSRLKKGITSASSIRLTVKEGKKKKTKKCLPKYSFKDIKEYPFAFDKMIMTSVLTTSEQKMSQIPDCTEGLENRIKALSKDNLSVDKLIEKVTTKRYPSSRIRRILISCLLDIDKNLVDECLECKLYAKILAVNEDSKDLISLLCEKSKIPVLTRKSDVDKLKKTAEKCFRKDVLANDLYSLATNQKLNENNMLII
ncbi:MAG: nucleotidyltransferase family protein [Clostridiales bacterium]|nr:nucleotidyltransferase family protein [Clostridiales bacterium]